MFDVGFWELALIGVIALIVVGPDRLPGMARTVGFWVGRARRYVDQVKRDVERELHTEELRNTIHGKGEGLDDLYEAVNETKGAMREAASEFESAADTARDAGSTTGAGDESAAQPWTAGIPEPAGPDDAAESAAAGVPGEATLVSGSESGAGPAAESQPDPSGDERRETQR